MTYEESSNLMTDLPFRGRVKVAALKYANYVMDEPSTTPGHSSRFRWAQRFATQPDIEAANLQPMVVMDSGVQAAGAAISDAELQTATETTINKFI